MTPHVCDAVPHATHRRVKLGEGTGTRSIMKTDHWLAALQCSGEKRYMSAGQERAQGLRAKPQTQTHAHTDSERGHRHRNTHTHTQTRSEATDTDTHTHRLRARTLRQKHSDTSSQTQTVRHKHSDTNTQTQTLREKQSDTLTLRERNHSDRERLRLRLFLSCE